MHRPPLLQVQFRRSRLAIAFVVISYGATGVLAMCMPGPSHVRLVVLALVCLAAAIVVHRISGPAAPASMTLGIDRRVKIVTRGEREIKGEVLAGSYVGAHVTTIVWRPIGARLARSLLVLPDSLPPADFRRLRVMLRYGRGVSDAADGNSDVTASSS